MDCPKCGKKIGDKDNVCSNCGVVIKENAETTKLSTKLFSKKNKTKNPLETSKLGKAEKLRSRFGAKQLKLILAVIVFILLALIIITLIMSISSGKGKKLAGKVSEYVGSTVTVAETKLDEHFKDKSAFSGLNKSLEFDYVRESEDSVKVDGMTYPEWAVLIKVDKKQHIETVKYCDFKLLKGDVRGVKSDNLINLDKFDKGTSYNKVNDEIDLKAYSITYTSELRTYRFRYWYENDSGDEQQVILDVSFDSDNNFLYYTSTMTYPENL
ncbi:MAG: zinc ribbon domain-containing protein [Ruminococcus sp.]|nr:zinc ribbon domain-containing protein [Ruminococcus sp.]